MSNEEKKFMEETARDVFVTGLLVKKEFEQKEVNVKDEKGNIVGKDNAISGKLLLRTKDGSEHEIEYYSRQHKKDGGENAIFKGLLTVDGEYKSLEHFEDADVIRVGACQFDVNDYKGSDGELKSYLKLSAKFANRLTPEEIEKEPQVSKFEIEGIIDSITDEVIKDEATGNQRIVVNTIGYQDSLVPVNVTVMKEMVEAFNGAGFFDGGVAKLWGTLVNTKEVETVTEKSAFGSDNVKVVTKTISRKEITGGNPIGALSDKNISDSDYDQAKSKRKLKLEEIKNAKKNDSGNSNGASAKPSGAAENPFASKSGTSSNPFASN